ADIRAELALIRKRVDKITQKDRTQAIYLENRIRSWIEDVEIYSHDDLRLAWRSLKGIKTYLQQQEDRIEESLRNKQRANELARLEEERQEEHKRARDAALAKHLEFFTAIQEEYPELISEGVRQRLDVFREALSVNLVNQDTLKRIEDFKADFRLLVEKHQDELAQHEYLKKVLQEAVEGTAEDGPDGESSITGIIKGSPIKFVIKPKSNEIRLDTPDDGSCKTNIQTLITSLGNKGIQLGPIQIIKTGEMIHSQSLENDIRSKIKQ
ncbi:MAG: hypothetical protein RBS43_05335, partial [Candidatus Cloacimonas sp.]|nr:hypothetical protein [Candidatus Cloacimonas sp.]